RPAHAPCSWSALALSCGGVFMKRIAIYLLRDGHGVVDDYVTHCLRELHPHVDRIVVISKTSLSEAGRRKIESITDEVWQSEVATTQSVNDTAVYAEAVQRVGS